MFNKFFVLSSLQNATVHYAELWTMVMHSKDNNIFSLHHIVYVHNTCNGYQNSFKDIQISALNANGTEIFY